jgi:hypothetical protein
MFIMNKVYDAVANVIDTKSRVALFNNLRIKLCIRSFELAFVEIEGLIKKKQFEVDYNDLFGKIDKARNEIEIFLGGAFADIISDNQYYRLLDLEEFLLQVKINTLRLQSKLPSDNIQK